MSVRTTCDADDCLASFGVPGSLATVRKTARENGWMIGDGEPWSRDLCPACFEAEQDHLYDNPPQDEGDGPPCR